MEAKTPKQLAELMLEHNYPGCVNDVAQAYLDLLEQQEGLLNSGPGEEDGPWAEGWLERCGKVAAPVEPTEEMLEAAHDAATFGNMDLIKDEIEAIYRAMIAVNKEKV